MRVVSHEAHACTEERDQVDEEQDHFELYCPQLHIGHRVLSPQVLVQQTRKQHISLRGGDECDEEELVQF